MIKQLARIRNKCRLAFREVRGQEFVLKTEAEQEVFMRALSNVVVLGNRPDDPRFHVLALGIKAKQGSGKTTASDALINAFGKDQNENLLRLIEMKDQIKVFNPHFGEVYRADFAYGERGNLRNWIDNERAEWSPVNYSLWGVYPMKAFQEAQGQGDRAAGLEIIEHVNRTSIQPHVYMTIKKLKPDSEVRVVKVDFDPELKKTEGYPRFDEQTRCFRP